MGDEPEHSEEAVLMPKVGDKHFPYTKKGEKAATDYAKKTGQKEVKKR